MINGSKTLHVKKNSLITFPVKPRTNCIKRQKKIGPTHSIHPSTGSSSTGSSPTGSSPVTSPTGSSLVTSPTRSPTSTLSKIHHSNKNLIRTSKVNYQYSFDDKYKKETFLSQGSWSEVYCGTLHCNSNERVAIKQIRKLTLHKKDEKVKTQVQREIDIHLQLKHPNIIRLIETFEDECNIYLVMEYAEQGDLFDKLSHEKIFSEKQSAKYMLDICKGLDYCHDLNIIHRDIKLENILIGNDGHLKIADFGWAIQTQDLCNSFCGTLEFLPPEILKGDSYGPQCDVWSLGILMYEMLCGTNPFGNRSSLNEKDCYWIILSHKIINEEPSMNSSYITYKSKDLLRKMLCKDVETRITLKDILQHPWITCNTLNYL